MDNFSQLEKYYNGILTDFDRFSIIFWIIPILVALWNRKQLNNALKIYLYYSLVHFGLHILEHIHIWAVMKSDPFWELMKLLNIKDTTFFNIFYRLAGFYFVGKFYSAILNLPLSKIIYRASLICIVLAVWIFWFIDGYNKFGIVNLFLIRLFLIVMPMIFLNQLYSQASKSNRNLWKNSYFLISISLLVSNVLSMLFALVAERIHYTDFVLYAQLSIIRNVISILTDLIVAYAFCKANNVLYFKF
jgi:hypothetical protein